MNRMMRMSDEALIALDEETRRRTACAAALLLNE